MVEGGADVVQFGRVARGVVAVLFLAFVDVQDASGWSIIVVVTVLVYVYGYLASSTSFSCLSGTYIDCLGY